MTDIIKFYTYGRGFAPKGWTISYRPYANRLYCIYGGTAFFLGSVGEQRLKPHHLYVFPHHLEFRVRQNEDDPLDHLYFDFTILPPFLFHEPVEMQINDHSPIGYTVAALSCLLTQYSGRNSDPDFPRLTNLILKIFSCSYARRSSWHGLAMRDCFLPLSISINITISPFPSANWL